MEQLLRQGYIGNPAQLVTLRRVTVSEGRARGTEIIEVKTAGGLELDILPEAQAGRTIACGVPHEGLVLGVRGLRPGQTWCSPIKTRMQIETAPVSGRFRRPALP